MQPSFASSIRISPQWLCLCLCLSGFLQINCAAAAKIEDGDYYIVSRNTYKVLTAEPSAGGAFRIVQGGRKPKTDSAQIWHVRRIGANYEISSKKYAKFLDVKDANLGDEAAIQLGEHTGRENQRWEFSPVGAYFNIIALHSGKGLNVTGSSTVDDAPVIQYAVNNADNNLWALYKASEAVRLPSAKALLKVGKSSFDNQNRTYRLAALPAAAIEALRMNRDKPADDQPSGLYIDKGDAITIEADGVTVDGASFYAAVGPMNAFFSYDAKNDPYLVPLHQGKNQFSSQRSGLLYFHYLKTGFEHADLPPIEVKVKGGSPIPFYVDGKTSLAEWKRQLESYKNAPFVEMVDARAIITVSRPTFNSLSSVDPDETFRVLDKILTWDDSLSGFDSSSALHIPTPLRLHYVEDNLTSKKDIANVYMYASDYFIGMTPGSVIDLVRPDYLKKQWAIWHETGHTYQQHDWLWSTIVESTVNIYSLYVQEQFGLPSRLDEKQGRQTTRENARDYIGKPGRKFEVDSQFTDDDRPWVRLVPFEQLRKGLGDDFYRKLHKYYREHPLAYGEDSDTNKIQIFVYRSSLVARKDLTDFFAAWGFDISDKTRSDIRALHVPSDDLSKVGFH